MFFKRWLESSIWRQRVNVTVIDENTTKQSVWFRSSNFRKLLHLNSLDYETRGFPQNIDVFPIQADRKHQIIVCHNLTFTWPIFLIQMYRINTKILWDHFKRPLLICYISSFYGNIDKTSKIQLNDFNYDTIAHLCQTVFSQYSRALYANTPS